jgi:hypothetical protein
MSYAKKIITHPWPAGMLAILFSFLPFISWLALILIGLMTLCRGPRIGLWIAVCAAAPACVYGFNHPDALLVNTIGGCFYTWLSAMVFWYSRSWNLVLEVTLLCALIGIAIIHLLVPDIASWWVHHYHDYLNELQRQVTQLDEINGSDVVQILGALNESDVIPRLASITTGIVFALVLLFNLINILLARVWQISAFDSHSRISQELNTIRIGYVALIAFMMTLIMALVGWPLAFDFIPIFMAIYFCAGLSLLHFYANRIKNGVIGLVIIYALMVFLPAYVIPLLLSCALLDTLFNFRQRA